jgi:predicted nucleotidyltransferase
MSGSDPLLDRAGLEEALRRLGERLVRRGVVADVYVVGGAAMALAYDARRSTRDIDAVFEPHGVVLDEARAVAAEVGLPSWWLNEQASVYVAAGGDPGAPRVFDHPGLRVSAASPEHLLAMKVLAARRRDADDIRFLVKHLGLASVQEVLTVCAEVFPQEPVPDRARLILEDASSATTEANISHDQAYRPAETSCT